MKHLSFTILVIGAGPTGLAAATSAAQYTTNVGLIDDNPQAGGQIWRAGGLHTPNKYVQHWLEKNTHTITMLYSTRVIALLKPGMLLVESADQAFEVHFEQLIIATGARELFLPFPGWTLPGVMGAGGLQALVKGGLPVKDKRIVVAGSGPLLLAVAAYLNKKGAHVRMLAEQTSWKQLATFALNLTSDHIWQSGQLGWNLAGIPLRANSWVSQAHGTDQLKAVTLQHGNTTATIACDYLACGFGLIPNTELPTALGCAVIDGRVQVDEWQQSSLQGVYCAGEVTGIGGLDLSLIEGQIAGLTATGKLDAAHRYFPARKRARRFAILLERCFALRSELKTLAEANTIICRCEDVRYHEIQPHPNWRSAKLHTRCGMGPCQGRICGAATSFLFGWTPPSVRPPITVARLISLAQINTNTHQHEEIDL